MFVDRKSNSGNQNRKRIAEHFFPQNRIEFPADFEIIRRKNNKRYQTRNHMRNKNITHFKIFVVKHFQSRIILVLHPFWQKNQEKYRQ